MLNVNVKIFTKCTSSGHIREPMIYWEFGFEILELYFLGVYEWIRKSSMLNEAKAREFKKTGQNVNI